MARVIDSNPNIFRDLARLGGLKAMLIGIIEPEIAKYAAIHELREGWLRDTIDQHLEKYEQEIAKALDEALVGGDPITVIEGVSKQIVQDLQQAVADRGLVRTGAMLSSIADHGEGGSE